jgi:drug/metabolite transporter (DMT)-like permease
MSPLRLALLCGLALTGFAANSLLARAALGGALAGAAAFTAIRLLSGALVLALLALGRPRAGAEAGWPSALALFLYAAPFSLAYLSLSAGVGALLLFGAVQATMMLAAVLRGERPPRRKWAGLALAFAGLAVLTLPGAHAPPPLAAAAMLGAGAAWGWYSLRGRRARDGVAATADAFVRSAPLAAALWAGASLLAPAAARVSPSGAALALASGALASGLGYTLWNMALPHLPASTAAVLQLLAPALAAAGGVALLGERITLRILAGGAAILCGVGIAVLRSAPRGAVAGAAAPRSRV